MWILFLQELCLTALPKIKSGLARKRDFSNILHPFGSLDFSLGSVPSSGVSHRGRSHYEWQWVIKLLPGIRKLLLPPHKTAHSQSLGHTRPTPDIWYLSCVQNQRACQAPGSVVFLNFAVYYFTITRGCFRLFFSTQNERGFWSTVWKMGSSLVGAVEKKSLCNEYDEKQKHLFSKHVVNCWILNFSVTV